MLKNELNEHQECIIFAKFLKSINCLYTKTAQEIRTPSYGQIQKQKSEGLNSGLPDYVIIVRCCSGKRKLCLVEMKRQKGGVISESQKKRINQLLECGINATISHGAVSAISYIQGIIKNN